LAVPILMVVVSACITSESGEAPDGASSFQPSASSAGLAALSDGPLDPATCEGVLGTPPSSHTLEVQSLTDTAQDGNQQIDTMCSALFDTSVAGEPFLAVALIEFDSDDSAIEHYELLKTVFLSENHPISEVNGADENQLDRLSVLIDDAGIGRTTVMRQNDWLVTVSIGPRVEDSLWTTDDVQVIAESIISRAQD
jgi:hypothetical protein